MKTNYVYNRIRKSSIYSSLFMVSVLVTVIIIIRLIPFSEIFSPIKISVANSASTVYDSGVEYIDLTANEIYYTGYDSYRSGHKTGSYYYSLVNNSCTLILIKDKSSNPPETLTNYHIQARLVKNSSLSKSIIKKLAKDLNWTTDGLSSVISNVTIDETAYHYEMYIYVALSLASILIIFLSLLITNIIFIAVPGFHPACINFNRLGGSIKELNQVNREINNMVVFRTRNLILTERYIISTSALNLEIIPIRAIVWAYEHAHTPRFFKIKTNYKHTLNLLCRHRIYLYLPKDSEDNINNVLAFLRENYPNIIMGYSKENREMALKKSVVKKHTPKKS